MLNTTFNPPEELANLTLKNLKCIELLDFLTEFKSFNFKLKPYMCKLQFQYISIQKLAFNKNVF